MPTSKYSTIFVLLIVLTAVAACTQAEAEIDEDAPDLEKEVVEILALDYAFAVPEVVPGGWTTLRLNNEHAHEIHEIGLGRLPEGVSFADYQAEVMPLWEEAVAAYEAGEVTDAEGFYSLLAERLPDWYHDLGVGTRTLVSPGRATQNHLHLEPGTYVLECWVKAPDGRPHILLGMVAPMTVVEDSHPGVEPDPDVEVWLTDGEISTAGALRPGDQTIALRLEEEPAYDNIQLIRLGDDTDLRQVASWLDWFSDGGLTAPAPADFLGGFHAYGVRQPGNSAYFTVEDVRPGRYAWILEAPGDAEIWKTFTVEP